MASERAALALSVGALLLGACSKKPYDAPEIEDPPLAQTARRGSIERTAPAYGIAVGRSGAVQLEVNVEAQDAPSLRAGQPCVAYVPPSTAAASCAVARLLPAASEETGQAIAWLSPRGGVSIEPGEFVFAVVTTGSEREGLAVPGAAVLTKAGKTWVVKRAPGKDGHPAFEPVEVRVGATANGRTQVLSGLQAGEQVLVQGGLGYLYPEFKAAAGD